jgi:hypothetical protein
VARHAAEVRRLAVAGCEAAATACFLVGVARVRGRPVAALAVLGVLASGTAAFLISQPLPPTSPAPALPSPLSPPPGVFGPIVAVEIVASHADPAAAAATALLLLSGTLTALASASPKPGPPPPQAG